MDITFETILGKTILVGFTHQREDGEVLEQTQSWGTVVRADKDHCVVIQKASSDETFTLPPDLRSFRIAPPGEYRLRSTGEVVVDPDLLTTWIITKS